MKLHFKVLILKQYFAKILENFCNSRLKIVHAESKYLGGMETIDSYGHL